MTQNDIADRLDALEAQLNDQKKTIDRQQERIEEQEAIIKSQRERLNAESSDADDDSERAVLNRRTALQAGGILGLLGLGAGTASANASGQIGTSSDPLQQLYTEELNGGVTGDAQLTNIAGTNLSIDSAGNLNASGGGGGSGAWVEGDNTSLLKPDSKDGIEVDTIADDGTGLTIQTDGNRVLGLGTVTQRTVNNTEFDAGGNVVAGHPQNSVIDAVGTVIGGGGAEADGGNLPHTVSGDFATVSGGIGNTASGSGATISGGSMNKAGEIRTTISGGSENEASGQWGTVGGGENNVVKETHATVGGGNGNTASTNKATVGGGDNNTASGSRSTVAGGEANTASSGSATVAGGNTNTASGRYATVPGGFKAEAKSNRSFVWNDGTGYADIKTEDGDSNASGLSSDTNIDGSGVTGDNTFSVSATNGFRFITGGQSDPNVTYIDSNGSLSVPTAPSSDDDVLRYQERVERASVTIGGVDNSGNDDSWGQSTTATKTWPNPFSDPNVVIVATIDEDESDVPANEVTVSVKNVTSSEFDIVVHQMAAVDRSGDEVDYEVNVMIRKGPPQR